MAPSFDAVLDEPWASSLSSSIPALRWHHGRLSPQPRDSARLGCGNSYYLDPLVGDRSARLERLAGLIILAFTCAMISFHRAGRLFSTNPTVRLRSSRELSSPRLCCHAPLDLVANIRGEGKVNYNDAHRRRLYGAVGTLTPVHR
jgi:hypothetical protein